MGNVLSQTDGLNNVTTYGYNTWSSRFPPRRARSCRSLGHGGRIFANLPQTPGQARTYTVYVQATAFTGSYTVDRQRRQPALTPPRGASATPLGSGWYEAGHRDLGVQRHEFHAGLPRLGLGARKSASSSRSPATTYTPTGLVATRDQCRRRRDNYGYDALGDKPRKPIRPPIPTSRTSGP